MQAKALVTFLLTLAFGAATVAADCEHDWVDCMDQHQTM